MGQKNPRVSTSLACWQNLEADQTFKSSRCYTVLLARLCNGQCPVKEVLFETVKGSFLSSICFQKKKTLLLMEEILHQLIGSSSHYLQGFIPLRVGRLDLAQQHILETWKPGSKNSPIFGRLLFFLGRKRS